ncbi:uncharacterized protein LOC120779819 [Bactrocera tryoni]|uniref:uncharacterized protein LOC120779819 n=1 Tax=Bactrocera tryoni TaxID=59916 RepID=UPI001A958ECD|nr:uncharacterized protein LOC120779819 [Bactrocera tryoni]
MSVFIPSAYLLNQMNWKSDEKVARRLLRDHSNPLDIPEPVFISYYRINKEAFRNVVSDIEPLIHLSSIPVELKLATTLRFLAEGGFQRSIGKDSHIACDRTTVSKILKEMLNVLERTQCPKWVKFMKFISPIYIFTTNLLYLALLAASTGLTSNY